MTEDFGRAPTGQALAVPATPASAVDGPTGFDPSRGKRAEQLLRLIVKACHSHIDGRDLLAEIHPRRTLDIKRRVDGRETWHQGDWLSDLSREIDRAKAYLLSADIADNYAGRNGIAQNQSGQPK